MTDLWVTNTLNQAACTETKSFTGDLDLSRLGFAVVSSAHLAAFTVLLDLADPQGPGFTGFPSTLSASSNWCLASDLRTDKFEPSMLITDADGASTTCSVSMASTSVPRQAVSQFLRELRPLPGCAERLRDCSTGFEA